MFKYVLGMKEVDENFKVRRRTAVRAIIFHEEKILMVKTNKGDYKFPGGGVNENEHHDEALIREINEETGYVAKTIGEKIGEVIERRMDSKEKGEIFEMTSHYYLCNLTGDITEQKLDDYEEEQGFAPEFIEIEKAIANNRTLLEDENCDRNIWVPRDTMVLEELLKIM